MSTNERSGMVKPDQSQAGKMSSLFSVSLCGVISPVEVQVEKNPF